jgi:hypothetical protein
MGVNKTVFGSRAERSNYQRLISRWGDRYSLWHNIPFLNIFTRAPLINPDTYDLRSMTISDIDWQRLKKTSVDYVLCDPQFDKPLVAIDFDGIQDGFNNGRNYIPESSQPSPWRSQIMSLKLKVAHGSLFPYFVVSSKHFADVSPRIRLCIVDGIIGEVLAKNATSARFATEVTARDLGITEQELDALTPRQQHGLLQDFVFSVEIENDFEHNPIYGEVARLSDELGWPSMSQRFLDAPGTRRSPNGKLIGEPVSRGAECVINTDDVGVVTRMAWLPNFNVLGFMGIGLVEEIAHLMALDEVRRRRANAATRPTPPSSG